MYTFSLDKRQKLDNKDCIQSIIYACEQRVTNLTLASAILTFGSKQTHQDRRW